MSNTLPSHTVTTPARPNSRINARPITNGGVMIGRIDSARKSGFIGNRVRNATRAKARPSSVVNTPTSVASATVFQATPQLRVPAMQSRPQIDLLNNFDANNVGAKLPSLSRTAEDRMHSTG